MSDYSLVLACALLIFAQATIGLRATENFPGLAIHRRLIRLAFVISGGVGIGLLIWGGKYAVEQRYAATAVVKTNIAAEQGDVQLKRIALALGVDGSQPLPKIADAIIKRLPPPVWRIQPVQRKALGQALDEVAVADRFPIAVRSIPSDANSVAFSDDIIEVLRAHGWAVTSRREFGINTTLEGVLIAVSPTVKSNDEVPGNAKRLILLLQKAGLSPYGAPLGELKPGQFELVIGNGPQASILKAAP